MRSFFELNQTLYFLLLIFSLILLAVFYKRKRHSGLDPESLKILNPSTRRARQVQDDTEVNKKVIIISFAILFFIFGAWRTGGEIKKTQNLLYESKTFQEKAIVEKVSPNAFGQNLIINLENSPGGEAGISLLIQVPRYPEYVYGDELEVSCIAKVIENKDTEFDYRMYMAKEGVLYSCDLIKSEEFNGVNKIGENKGSIFLGGILKIRQLFENNIRAVIPQPEGALASGLLFGGNSGLSKEIQDDFSRTGMSHIVAVSGYNVTIIAEYLILLGLWLGMWRKNAAWFALFGIAAFVIMIGFPSSAVRAGVMGGILLWAMKNGRLANSKNAIVFAAAIMLAINPLLLRWDIGFQLSFLATLGIVETSAFWEKSFIKKHKALGISEIIALSLSAQIFVLPIIAYNFHITSLISLLANVLILPIIPLSMLLVFLVSLFGFIFYGISLVFAWLAFIPLLYEIKIVQILAGLPWASISVEKIGAEWVVVYYLVIGAGVYYFRKREKILNSKL